ncbi:Protein ECERIFERUM 26 [Bienertia sinuspersici]
MNTLSQFLRGMKPAYPPNLNKSPLQNQKLMTSHPQSLKDVGPLGDNWIMPLPSQMDTFSFHVRPKQLAQLKSKLSKNSYPPSPLQPFELLSAVIWRAVARIRNGPEPNPVNIIKKDSRSPIEDIMSLRNNQFVGLVKANFSVAEAHVEELAAQIRDMVEDERDQIRNVVGQDPGNSDFIIYGSNLTFMNLEEVDFYGFEVNGLSPRFVNCFIDGIGEEGVILVLPSPKYCNNDYKDNMKFWSEGRIVTLILPKSYMMELKKLLEDWGLII